MAEPLELLDAEDAGAGRVIMRHRYVMQSGKCDSADHRTGGQLFRRSPCSEEWVLRAGLSPA